MNSKLFNIYCDESCHLEKDGNDIMVLGCVSCEISQVKKVNQDIRRFKEKHGLSADLEVKWSKVGPGKLDFYLNLIDYFFDNRYINFRAVIASGKHYLSHEDFNQTHDDWYYKMYFYLLREVIDVQKQYRIFVDIKDTRSAEKIRNLKDVLNYSLYKFYDEVIIDIQSVRSHEVGIIQLTDLFIGALSYLNRNLTSNDAKLTLIKRIQDCTGFNLKTSTSKWEDKLNIFVWHPRRKT